MSQINPGDRIDWRHGGYLTTGRVVDVDDHSVIASGIALKRMLGEKK